MAYPYNNIVNVPAGPTAAGSVRLHKLNATRPLQGSLRLRRLQVGKLFVNPLVRAMPPPAVRWPPWPGESDYGSCDLSRCIG
jgi:hypothetical protein